ncbi:MAG: dockerin type I domain-containing protein [bacterium]
MKPFETLFLLAMLAVAMFPLFASVPAMSQTGAVIAYSVTSNSNPANGEQITVNINIDMSGVSPPDDKLGSFTATLDWDPAVLCYVDYSDCLPGFACILNDAGADAGHITFNGANPTGVGGTFTVLTITFNVCGLDSSGTDLDLEFSAVAAAKTFRNLLPVLIVHDGYIRICCPCGDVNCDGQITPGDALCAFWRYILGHWQEECECSEQAADVNCDGQITPGDALCCFWRYLLGYWQDECPACQCGRVGKVSEQTMTAFNVSLTAVMGPPGEMVRVPIVADNPQGLSVFGMDLTFPEDLLEFQEVSRARLTKAWIALDGTESSSGVITLGGFNTEAMSSTEEEAIAEVTFVVKNGVSGKGDLACVNFVDDLEGAALSKGSFVVNAVPTIYTLQQNYPNPFNPNTDIRYQIPNIRSKPRPETGTGSGMSESRSKMLIHTTLKIYNILGQEVRTLVDEFKDAGYYTVIWEGRDSDGREVGSGVYIHRIHTGCFVDSKKMMLIR